MAAAMSKATGKRKIIEIDPPRNWMAEGYDKIAIVGDAQVNRETCKVDDEHTCYIFSGCAHSLIKLKRVEESLIARSIGLRFQTEEICGKDDKLIVYRYAGFCVMRDGKTMEEMRSILDMDLILIPMRHYEDQGFNELSKTFNRFLHLIDD